MDGDKHCTAVFDLRGAYASGSASRVGQAPASGAHGSAQVKFSAKFAFAGIVDLTSATVTVDALLGEEGGAGELVAGVPIALRARRGRRSTAARLSCGDRSPYSPHDARRILDSAANMGHDLRMRCGECISMS